MRPTIRFALAALLAVGVLVAAGCGGDDEDTGETDTTTETTSVEAGSTLRGSVGPGFDISLTGSDGQSLGSLAPGSYRLEVDDQSSAHNFHLTGPGDVDVSTSVEDEGTDGFDVVLEAGTYTFVCDPHASSMNGTFEVSE